MILHLANQETTVGQKPSVQSPSIGNGTVVTYSTFQAVLNSGTSVTVSIEGSNDNLKWVQVGTITLSGAGSTDGFVKAAPWPYLLANITAITGNVTVTAGV